MLIRQISSEDETKNVEIRCDKSPTLNGNDACTNSIKISTLEGTLFTNDVCIDTTKVPGRNPGNCYSTGGNAGNAGDISFIDSPVTWSGQRGIFLKAQGDIFVNQPLNATQGGYINFKALGEIRISAPITLTNAGTFNATLSSAVLEAPLITVNSSITTGSFLTLTSTTEEAIFTGLGIAINAPLTGNGAGSGSTLFPGNITISSELVGSPITSSYYGTLTTNNQPGNITVSTTGSNSRIALNGAVQTNAGGNILIATQGETSPIPLNTPIKAANGGNILITTSRSGSEIASPQSITATTGSITIVAGANNSYLALGPISTTTGSISIITDGSTSPITLFKPITTSSSTGSISIGTSGSSSDILATQTIGSSVSGNLTMLTLGSTSPITTGALTTSNSNTLLVSTFETASDITTGPLVSGDINLSSLVSGITTNGDTTSNGPITYTAGGNITALNLFSPSSAINLTSTGGAITLIGITAPAASSIVTLKAGTNINISGFLDYGGSAPLLLNAGQNINLVGSLAHIFSTLGPINITAGGAVTLNSDADPATIPTQILGPNTINISANSLALNPGKFLCNIQSTGSSVNLNIGLGGIWLNAEKGSPATILSPVPISWTGLNGTVGPLVLRGLASILSNGPANIIARGVNVLGSTTSNDGNPSITAHGDITITSYDSVQVAGGTAANSTATIFALDPGDKITLNTPDHDLILQGGSGASSRAFIGTLSGPISLNPDPFTPGDDLILMGGSGMISDATIQPGSGDLIGQFFSDIVMSGGSSSSNGSANIVADGNISLSANTLSLFGGRGNGNNQAQILSNSGSITLTTTGVDVGGNMQFIGQQNNNINQAVLVFADTGLSIQAGKDITMDGNAIVQTNTEDLLMIAGRNMTIGNHSQIRNFGNGDITLVVDNQFPTFPFFGPGQFNFLSGAFVSPEGRGVLRIFTSVRSQNTIEGELNGKVFVPGETYVNTPFEHWGVYYPRFFSGGGAFTIFYKDSPEDPAPGQEFVCRKCNFFNQCH